MDKTVLTSSFKETQALGEKIAQEMKDGGIVCLYGDLGSGKTTFTQGFAKALGIKQQVNSPSFLIVRTYELSGRDFYHVDLYRLESIHEMETIGLSELFLDPKNIVIIEWAEKLGSLLPRERIDVHFTYLTEEKRQIQITDTKESRI